MNKSRADTSARFSGFSDTLVARSGVLGTHSISSSKESSYLDPALFPLNFRRSLSMEIRRVILPKKYFNDTGLSGEWRSTP